MFVDAAEPCDKMIFERVNYKFGSVSSMEAWGNELVVNRFVDEELFEGTGALVVKAL